MWKKTLYLFYGVWLVIITPFFGIFPLLMALGIRLGDFEQTERNLLRGFWAPLLGDPGQGIEDAGSSLPHWAGYTMIAVVMGIAFFILLHLSHIISHRQKVAAK